MQRQTWPSTWATLLPYYLSWGYHPTRSGLRKGRQTLACSSSAHRLARGANHFDHHQCSRYTADERGNHYLDNLTKETQMARLFVTKDGKRYEKKFRGKTSVYVDQRGNEVEESMVKQLDAATRPKKTARQASPVEAMRPRETTLVNCLREKTRERLSWASGVELAGILEQGVLEQARISSKADRATVVELLTMALNLSLIYEAQCETKRRLDSVR